MILRPSRADLPDPFTIGRLVEPVVQSTVGDPSLPTEFQLREAAHSPLADRSGPVFVPITSLRHHRSFRGLTDDGSFATHRAPGKMGFIGRLHRRDQTRYVKEESTRIELSYRIDHVSLVAETCGDSVFPLITNELSHTDGKLLLAYKRQPVIEKRFSQLKTDIAVAPVYLKNVGRIRLLIYMYFFTLLTEALLERELPESMRYAERRLVRLQNQ